MNEFFSLKSKRKLKVTYGRSMQEAHVLIKQARSSLKSAIENSLDNETISFSPIIPAKASAKIRGGRDLLILAFARMTERIRAFAVAASKFLMSCAIIVYSDIKSRRFQQRMARLSDLLISFIKSLYREIKSGKPYRFMQSNAIQWAEKMELSQIWQWLEIRAKAVVFEVESGRLKTRLLNFKEEVLSGRFSIKMQIFIKKTYINYKVGRLQKQMRRAYERIEQKIIERGYIDKVQKFFSLSNLEYSTNEFEQKRKNKTLLITILGIALLATYGHIIFGAMLERASLVKIFKEGGLIMWPLLLASNLALGTVIERVYFLMNEKKKRNPAALQVFFEVLRRGDILTALNICKRSEFYVLRALGYALENRKKAIASALFYAKEQELKRFRAGIPILDTVITLAPLLGLLGTVTGMMGSFALIGGELSAPGAITGGIAEALIATAFGLGIAITSLIPFNILNTKVEEIMREIDSAATQMELILHGSSRPTTPAPDGSGKFPTSLPIHLIKGH